MLHEQNPLRRRKKCQTLGNAGQCDALSLRGCAQTECQFISRCMHGMRQSRDAGRVRRQLSTQSGKTTVRMDESSDQNEKKDIMSQAATSSFSGRAS